MPTRATRWLRFFIACLATGWAGMLQGAQPVAIGNRKQLFVDSYIIDSTHRAHPILQQPTKSPLNPLITLEPPQPVGGKQLVITGGTVMFDQQEKLFKMWYDTADYEWKEPAVLLYAVSEDGLTWETPNLKLFDHPYGYPNIVFRTDRGEVSPAVIKDTAEPDPAKRYKMLYAKTGPVGVAFSPDGIHWTPAEPSRPIGVTDSPMSVVWDSRLKKYVAHSRNNESSPEGPIRQVLQSESEDFLTWVPYGVIMKPDEHDLPWDRQFYNMEWMPYHDVLIGFISVFHILPGWQGRTPQYPWEDTIDIQLALSRDNRNWSRLGHRQTFIPTGSGDDFDAGMIFVMHHPIVVDEEIWIYYVGFRGRHYYLARNEVQGGSIGLARMPIDRFVAIDAGLPGELVTKPLIMTGDELIINADSRNGSVAVEVLDQDGGVIPGFSKGDAIPIQADGVALLASWTTGAQVASLQGRPIRLKFYLEQARLYSFVFQSEKRQPEQDRALD